MTAASSPSATTFEAALVVQTWVVARRRQPRVFSRYEVHVAIGAGEQQTVLVLHTRSASLYGAAAALEGTDRPARGCYHAGRVDTSVGLVLDQLEAR